MRYYSLPEETHRAPTNSYGFGKKPAKNPLKENNFLYILIFKTYI